MSTLDELIKDYIHCPTGTEENLHLALEYEQLGMWAGAITHYLKCVQFTKNASIKYECLLRMYDLYMRSDRRTTTAENCLQQAISVCPTLPEAYFLLSLHHEQQGNWQHSYTAASQGLAFSTPTKNMRTDISEHHEDYFLFQQAVSSWWIGRTQQSRELFHKLRHSTALSTKYINLVHSNIQNLGRGDYPILPYHNSEHQNLRMQFPGSGGILRNYSQAYQDMFVLMATDGMRSGTYLEVGAADPFKNNNTALLESEFQWTGTSVEIDSGLANKFNRERKNPCVCADATKLDYSQLLSAIARNNHVDYLQLDCEPATTTMQILTQIPLHQYTFGVITFEHDHYAEPDSGVREASRQLLSDMGYVLVAGNISPDWRSPFEDWWVHPDHCSDSVLRAITLNHRDVLPADEYIFSKDVSEPHTASEPQYVTPDTKTETHYLTSKL